MWLFVIPCDYLGNTATAHGRLERLPVSLLWVLRPRPAVIQNAHQTQLHAQGQEYRRRERGEERIVDIYASLESLRDQQQDYVGTEESSNSLGTGRSQRLDAVSPPRCPIRAVVVLLGLLSVVLLAGLLWLAVKHKIIMEKTVSMDRDMGQLLQRLRNVTEQRDTLICEHDCPVGWDKFGCKCYLSCNEYLSWNRSREFCVSQGADLVVVDSKEEMDFISKYNAFFWLGATDEASEGMWRWVDGTVLSLDDPSWSGGGHDGGGDNNCLRRDWKSIYHQNQFKWANESCEAYYFGLCENNVI